MQQERWQLQNEKALKKAIQRTSNENQIEMNSISYVSIHTDFYESMNKKNLEDKEFKYLIAAPRITFEIPKILLHCKDKL